MAEIAVLENTLSREGWRWMHLARMDEPISKEDAAAYLPAGAEQVTLHPETDSALGMQHLRISWPARELIRIKGAAAGSYAGRLGLLWAGGGKGLLEASLYAGLAYADLINAWPAVVLVQARPDKAPQTVPIYKDSDEEHVCRLEAAAWVPKGFLILLGEED